MVERADIVGRRSTASVWVAVIAVAAIAWGVTLAQGRTMGSGTGTMGLGPAPFLAIWVAMMAAMMLPSVAPVAIMWTRTITGTPPLRTTRTTSFFAGYLLAWASYGVAAYAAFSGAGRLAGSTPQVARWVGAGLYAAVGLYQLTPLKQACLRHCRTPIGLALHYSGFRGRTRDLRAGLHHGLTCVACCWGLMAALVAVGLMNLGAMVVLSGVVFLEKVWRRGPQLARILGVAFLVLAVLAPFRPWLLPGLHVTGPMTGMMGS